MRNPTLKRLGVSIDEYRTMVRAALAPHRTELLQQRGDWIRRVGPRMETYFVSGEDVDVRAIRPELELVTTERQHDIWRYGRLFGSIPYNRGCGRLLRYLLRDMGQPGAPVMGVIALSSPILICRPRDTWIGWEYPSDLEVKRRGLLACVDLSVSMAVPPYNHLTAGKMISLAVLASAVREDYWRKFHAAVTASGMREGRLALITTTSLYGSSVQYNRLRIGTRHAYELVGYTSGFGNAHLTESEFKEMEEYLRSVGNAIPKGWGTGRSYRLRVYTAYCRERFGERQAPAHKQTRSVYVAPLASNTQRFLRGEDQYPRWYDIPLWRLAAIWREQWLLPRLRNAEVMERFVRGEALGSLLRQELQGADPGDDRSQRAS